MEKRYELELPKGMTSRFLVPVSRNTEPDKPTNFPRIQEMSSHHHEREQTGMGNKKKTLISSGGNSAAIVIGLTHS